MKIVWQVYYEVIPIVNFFSWHTFSRCNNSRTRSANQPRLASIISLNAKKQLTLDAVIGKNDKEIRKKILANAKASSSTLSLKKKCKAWCDFMDDLVFLKHLDKVVFMNVTEDTNFIQKILPDMVNKNVYNPTQDRYFVGFPVNTNTNENSAVTQNTPFYDHNTVGTVRFLDEKWVK